MERRLSAIFAVDMVGYSRLTEADEIGTIERHKAHRRELIDPAFEQHHGRIVTDMGDGLLVEFPSVVEAINCAVQIQRAMPDREAGTADDRRIQYRIGINSGDIVIDNDNIRGDGVNVAARLEQLAEPGGICISGTAYDHVSSQVDAAYESLGEVNVKNIERPIRAYKVLTEPALAGTAVGKRRTRFPGKPKLPANRLSALLIAVAVVIVISAGLLFWRPWAPDVEPASTERMAFALPDKPSIAILPFANLSADPDQEHFADAITEDIITDLSRLPYLFVIARNSTFTYKGRPVRVQQVAEELGVRYVLEGSIQKADQRVRVTAQLIDALNGYHIWAERYDRDLKDIFAVQDDVTQSISATLVGYGGRLTDTELKIARRKRPESLKAYDHYVLGSYYKHRFTKEDIIEARRHYEKAIELDPGFARAHLGLAWTHQHDLWLGWSDAPERSLALFKEHAKRAVDLDELDAEAHLALGQAYFIEGDVQRGAAAYEQAQQLGSNNADVLAILAWNLPATLGQSEEAVASIERAMRLNPHYPDWYRHALGYALYHVERYDDAADILETVENNTVETALYLAASYAQLGKKAEANVAAKEVLRLNPEFSTDQYMKNVGYKDPTAIAELLDGAKKAGLPE